MANKYKGVIFIPSKRLGVVQEYGKWKWNITMSHEGKVITKSGYVTAEKALAARNSFIKEHNLPNEIQPFKD